MKTVLIVDDETAIRETLEQILVYEGYAVRKAATGAEALAELEKRQPDAMLLDIKMPGMDGFEVLQRLKAAGHALPVIVISGHGTIETAVEAVKAGAYDFLEKPLERSRLLVTIANCLSHHKAVVDRRFLAEQAGPGSPLVGQSRRMREVQSFIDKVGPTEGTVLITGENGTGKGMVVAALHRASARRDRPLGEVNCAAIPKDLVESELFGHERGSFTGADRQRIGKFEQADGGTLFLDEIGDMTEEAQAKVLKAVEEGRFQRVGGHETRSVDVRIIAATNRDLAAPDSGFRQDLFFRLNVLAIHLPPLREREGDVDLLLESFTADLARRLKTTPRRYAPETLALLRAHSWPGNVRELRNLVERLLILAPDEIIRPADLPLLPGAPAAAAAQDDLFHCRDFQEFKARSEGAFLQHKLRENLYNVSRTAESLGMQRSNLYKKITKYGLRTQPDPEA
ncbi:MAG TPA: sigma-54 dependent transcriptional regulator [Candidatus Krumholzibacteria bacterium]|nr:sigma-54 dependent transcriptional regulator [Candidatus Krumholzibacteria bacterium]